MTAQAAPPHPFTCFEKTFVINLPSRADRRREMDDQLRRIGSSLAGIQLFSACQPDSPQGFPSKGARGCFMSHLEVLKRAVAERFDSVLILEDDVNFAADFGPRFATTAAWLARREWDMFYGGARVMGDLPAAGEGGCAVVGPDIAIQTTHFVAVRGKALELLPAYLDAMLARPAGDSLGGPMHIDGAYSWFRREHPQLMTLIAVPDLGHQRPSRTDIHDLNWYDRWPGVRQLAAAARRHVKKGR